MLKLAQRIQSLKGSAIMEIASKAAQLKAQGVDIISLAAGEPDFNTPMSIQEAATKAMADGITRYTPSQGFLALREVLAEKISRENGFPVTPDEILITSGAKHAIYLTLQCLAEPGDAILLPTPSWVSYGPMVELTGAGIIPLPLYEEDGFRPNVDRWKGMAIPQNVRGIILNSPNNPCGVAYTRDDLKRVVGWALQRNLWIMSDEIYEKILFDGSEHVSVASLGPEVRENTITISGFSKSFSMTGWRLGWAIGPKELISKMSALQSQSNSHVTSFVQWAAITAAKLPNSEVQKMVTEFDKRRHYVMGRLDKMKLHLTYVRPTGAFYVFMNVNPWLSQHKMNDVDFSKELLSKVHVGVVPGSSFGQEGWIRISYATSMQNLEKALNRIEEFLHQ